MLKKCVAFFQNTLCLQVESHSPNAHFVDESFDVRAMSDRYASSTRELNLDIQTLEKTKVFLYRWKTDVASHDVGCLVNPRRIIAYFFGLLLSLEFSNLMCHGGNLWNLCFCSFSKQQKAETWSYSFNSSSLTPFESSSGMALSWKTILLILPNSGVTFVKALKTCSSCNAVDFFSRWPSGYPLTQRHR